MGVTGSGFQLADLERKIVQCSAQLNSLAARYGTHDRRVQYQINRLAELKQDRREYLRMLEAQ